MQFPNFAGKRRLYRYCRYDANQLKLFLTSGELMFADPKRFNDPWDCVPRIEHKHRPTTATGWEAFRRRFIEIGEQFLEPGTSQHRVLLGDLLTTPLTPSAQMRLEQSFLESFDEAMSHVRVLCLSELGDVPLMWSHYADGHRGICLVFEAPHHIGSFSEAHAVTYQADYPSVPYPILTDVLMYGLLCKPSYWAYEHEFRMLAYEGPLLSIAGWQDIRVGFPLCHAGFVRVPREALVGVILGARLPFDQEVQIRAMLSGEMRPIEVWRARLQPDSYGVRMDRE